jgi:hypothetical protein
MDEPTKTGRVSLKINPLHSKAKLKGTDSDFGNARWDHDVGHPGLYKSSRLNQDDAVRYNISSGFSPRKFNQSGPAFVE